MNESQARAYINTMYGDNIPSDSIVKRVMALTVHDLEKRAASRRERSMADRIEATRLDAEIEQTEARLRALNARRKAAIECSIDSGIQADCIDSLIDMLRKEQQ